MGCEGCFAPENGAWLFILIGELPYLAGLAVIGLAIWGGVRLYRARTKR